MRLILTFVLLLIFRLSIAQCIIKVMQDGHEVAIKNHEVRLKKASFILKFEFTTINNINVQADTSPYYFNLIKNGVVMADTVDVFGAGRGMADYLFNKDKDIIFNHDGFNYFYYENKKDHRFDKVEWQDEKLIAYRKIKYLSFLTTPKIKVNKFKGPIYLCFMQTTFDDKFAKTELYRNWLQINWEE